MNNTTTPADQILSQLGGSSRVTIMTGARAIFRRGTHTLVVQLPRTRAVEITLDEGSDTYSIRTVSIKKTKRFPGGECVRSEPVAGVHVDELHNVLANETGLAWRL